MSDPPEELCNYEITLFYIPLFSKKRSLWKKMNHWWVKRKTDTTDLPFRCWHITLMLHQSSLWEHFDLIQLIWSSHRVVRITIRLFLCLWLQSAFTLLMCFPFHCTSAFLFNPQSWGPGRTWHDQSRRSCTQWPLGFRDTCRGRPGLPSVRPLWTCWGTCRRRSWWLAPAS